MGLIQAGRHAGFLGLPLCLLGAWGYTKLTGRGAGLLIGSMMMLSVPLRRLLKRRGFGLSDRGLMLSSAGWGAVAGDTTGAGDAFHSGFLYGFLTGEDLETSLKLGNAVAAIKCSALGARTALPTKPELDSFLRS